LKKEEKHGKIMVFNLLHSVHAKKSLIYCIAVTNYYMITQLYFYPGYKDLK